MIGKTLLLTAGGFVLILLVALTTVRKQDKPQNEKSPVALLATVLVQFLITWAIAIAAFWLGGKG